MATRMEQMMEILRRLRTTSTDVLGAAVISIDGFVIASVVPQEVDEGLVAGMAAAALGVGNRISQELMSAPLQQAFFRSEKGFVVLNAVGEEAVLIVLTTKEAKLGLLFIDIRRQVAELERLV